MGTICCGPGFPEGWCFLVSSVTLQQKEARLNRESIGTHQVVVAFILSIVHHELFEHWVIIFNAVTP